MLAHQKNNNNNKTKNQKQKQKQKAKRKKNKKTNMVQLHKAFFRELKSCNQKERKKNHARCSKMCRPLPPTKILHCPQCIKAKINSRDRKSVV